jgi:hypothetical protein
VVVAEPEPESTASQPHDHDQIGDDLGRIASGEGDATILGRLPGALGRSARIAGARAVGSGRWLAGLVIDSAPRIPVRDLRTLQEHHDGLSGAALAGELIRNASLVSGTVGAASGALMSVEEFAPPAWLAIPLELVVETLAVAAIEMKLIAELHEVYGRPVTGGMADRSMALVRAWADRRGVSAGMLAGGIGIRDAFGTGTRNEIVRTVRKRLLRRMSRNIPSLAPFLVGAAAGMEINRRATRSLGEAIARDLAGS